MKSMWIVRILCVLAVLGIFLSCGCGVFTAERNRRSMYAIRTDLKHMVDDGYWMVGLERPTKLYDEIDP